MNAESPSKGRRGRFRRALVALMAVVILASAPFATGWPQRKLVEMAARKFLGAEVEASGITSLGVLRMDELRIYGSKAAKAAGNPIFVATGLAVDYSLFPKGESYVSSITLDALRFHLDASDPENRNFDFLIEKFMDQEETAGDMAYVPGVVDIAEVRGDVVLPDARVSIDGLRLTGAFVGLEEFSLEVKSGTFTCVYEIPSEGVEVSAQGFVEVAVARNGSTVHCDLLAGVPDLLEAEGRITARIGDGLEEADLAFDTLRIYGSDFPVIAARFLPFPVQFDVLNASGLAFHAKVENSNTMLPDAQLHGFVQGLIVGDPEHPLFSGDLAVEGPVHGGEDGRGDLTFTFNGAQVLDVTLSGGRERAYLDVSFEDWPHGAVAALAPQDFRDYFEHLDYDRLDGSIQADWSDSGYEVKGKFQSTGTSRAGERPIDLSIEVHGSFEAEPLLVGGFDAVLGEGAMKVVARFDTAERFEATVRIENADIAPWTKLLTRTELPELLEGTLSGTITINGDEEGDFFSIASALSVVPFRYGDLALDVVDITGAVEVAKTFERLHCEEIQVTAGETLEGILRDWDGVLEPFAGEGRFEGTVDLTFFGELLGLDDLWGEAVFEGPIRVDGGEWYWPVSLRADPLGYGDLSTPYGTPVTATGTIEYNVQSLQGTVGDLEVFLGEGTRLAFEGLNFSTSPVAARGRFEFQSDFAAVVEMAFLAAAQATMQSTGQFAYSEDGLAGQWEAVVAATSLALPEDAAAIAGLAFKASGTYDDGFFGTGSLSAEEVSVAGAGIRSLSGSARFEGEHLNLPKMVAALFDGTVEAAVEVGLFEDGLPIRLEARFDSLDLAVLTKEVQPPSVELTGLASGSATVLYTRDGLTGFNIEMRSEENFSLNREMVEQVLRTDQFRSLLGAKKVEKALGKFLGSAPQRPFDSAELTLGLEEDRIVGRAVFKSVETKDYNGLNMTINLKIDVAALGEAMKLLEQAEMENMEF